MAKQIGDIKITGTVAGVTFYKMDGQYYARKKSSLEGKRVKTDPKFRRTMQSAERLTRGSQLASRVYRSLPREERVYAWFTELKSRAIRALKEGRSEEDVLALLHTCLAARLPACGTAPRVPITREAHRDQRPPAAAGAALKAGSTAQSHLFVGADGKLQAASYKLLVGCRESSRSAASTPKEFSLSFFIRVIPAFNLGNLWSICGCLGDRPNDVQSGGVQNAERSEAPVAESLYASGWDFQVEGL